MVSLPPLSVRKIKSTNSTINGVKKLYVAARAKNLCFGLDDVVLITLSLT
jgi:hypothetical protein